MALGRYGPEGFTYPGGRPAAFLAVEVIDPDLDARAQLYDDIHGTIPIPNPAQCDNQGNLTFCAEDGDYILYPSFGGELEVTVFSGGVGPPGPTGPQGLQGPKGDTGDPGSFALADMGKTINIAVPIQGPTTLSHTLGFRPAGIRFRDGAGRDLLIAVTASTTTTITVNPDLPFSGTIDLS